MHSGEGAYYAKIIAVSQRGEGVSKVKTPEVILRRPLMCYPKGVDLRDPILIAIET